MGAWLAALMFQALMMLHARKSSEISTKILSRPSSATTWAKLCFGFTVFWTYLM